MKRRKRSRIIFSVLLTVSLLLGVLPGAQVFAADDDLYRYSSTPDRIENASIMAVYEKDAPKNRIKVFCVDKLTYTNNAEDYRTVPVETVFDAGAAKIRGIYKNSLIFYSSAQLNQMSGLTLTAPQWQSAAQNAIWHLTNNATENLYGNTLHGYQWYLSDAVQGIASEDITGFPMDFIINKNDLANGDYVYSFTLTAGSNVKAGTLAVTFNGAAVAPKSQQGNKYIYEIAIPSDTPLDKKLNLKATWTSADADAPVMFVPVDGAKRSQTFIGSLEKNHEVSAVCTIVNKKGLTIRKVKEGGLNIDNFTFRVYVDGKLYSGQAEIAGVMKQVKNGIIELKGGRSATITGLAPNAKYSVEEVDGQLDMFSTTWATNSGNGDYGRATGEQMLDSDGSAVVTFTNTQKQGLLIKKAFDTTVQVPVAYKDKGFDLTLTLKKGGAAFNQAITVNGAAVRSDGNGNYRMMIKEGQTLNIQGLPLGVEYEVVEAVESNFSATYVNASGVVSDVSAETPVVQVINRFLPDSYTVTKEWKDEGNESSRPDSITVQLWQNKDGSDPDQKPYLEQVITPDEDGNWVCTFVGLPAIDSDGRVIDYSVTESSVKGYSPSVKKSPDNNFLIVNTKQGEAPKPPISGI